MDILWDAHLRGGVKRLLSLKSSTYIEMMKLGSYILPKDDPKNIRIMWHILSAAGISICLPKIKTLIIWGNTVINCLFLHNF